jgi:hypothetical protein
VADAGTHTDTHTDTHGDMAGTGGNLGSPSLCVIRSVWGVIKEEILGQAVPDQPGGALQSFIDYFEATWLCESSREWGVSGTEALRYANDLESWHDTMSLSVHPKDILWRIIPHLKDEQHAREKDVEKILLGTVGVPQRKFRKQKEEAINSAIAEYTAGNINACELVTRISYRMNH